MGGRFRARSYIGVGFPNVVRRLFDTEFLGDIYSFSNSSGERLILPAVWTLLRFGSLSAFSSIAKVLFPLSRGPGKLSFSISGMLVILNEVGRDG
jgi:hypothetical protein